VEAEAVDVRVVRLEVEAGQALEALVGGAEDFHGGRRLFGFAIKSRRAATGPLH
jgi:hypothetical protein